MIKELQIELTNACNASCLMCAHRHMKRPVEHMDLSLVRKIVEEWKTLVTDDFLIGICGIGEPILHPQFKEALNILKGTNYAVGTNCYGLNKENVQALIDTKFTDITLSIDAMTAEVHDKMRPGLNFDKCIEGANLLIDELRKVPKFWSNVYIQLIATDINKHEIDDFISHWLKETSDLEGIKIFIKPMYQWPGLDNPLFPGPSFPEQSNEKVVFGPFQDRTFRSRCKLFDNWALIQSNGDYQPCCMPVEDEFQVGNVKDNTIVELYNSPRMKELRELFKSKRYEEIPFCNKCI